MTWENSYAGAAVDISPQWGRREEDSGYTRPATLQRPFKSSKLGMIHSTDGSLLMSPEALAQGFF
ncbi:MAG: hypothetical protein JWN85_2944 [Gammaproteobacteria bacterium]|nr:hypothetical protein [Gammaproteobacteria bacterium]